MTDKHYPQPDDAATLRELGVPPARRWSASALGVVAAAIAGGAGAVLPARPDKRLAIAVGALALGALIFDIALHSRRQRGSSWQEREAEKSATTEVTR